MSKPEQIYRWHPRQNRGGIRIIMALAALGLGIGMLVAMRNEPSWIPRFLAVIFMLTAPLMVLDRFTWVDAAAGTITRENRLLARLRVWSKTYSLRDFTAVGMDRKVEMDGSDTVMVGLQPRTGRPLEVCYFYAPHGEPCPSAESAAARLATDTGLPLQETLYSKAASL